MGVPLVHVDAFTDSAFHGNPAAVCLLDGVSDDAAWMQSVANEMNLSETAFVMPRPDGDLDLRWFTPTVEVDLCGHATLASAHVLWETERLRPDAAARFHTRSGLLVAERAGDDIELDFPARPVSPAPVAGIETLHTPHPPLGTFDNGHQLLVELRDVAAVLATAPDFAPLGRAADRVWVVTAPAPADSEADFVSRCFGPRYGIDEDPVTGSAHCALAPFWADRLGRAELVGHQLSSRGGRVSVHLHGGRVTLGGRAVTIARGELFT
jgi:PhzF family phenazine biosynthesis protein